MTFEKENINLTNNKSKASHSFFLDRRTNEVLHKFAWLLDRFIYFAILNEYKFLIINVPSLACFMINHFNAGLYIWYYVIHFFLLF